MSKPYQFVIPDMNIRMQFMDLLDKPVDWNWCDYHDYIIISQDRDYISSRPMYSDPKVFITTTVDAEFMKMLELLPTREAKQELIFAEPVFTL